MAEASKDKQSSRGNQNKTVGQKRTHVEKNSKSLSSKKASAASELITKMMEFVGFDE